MKNILLALAALLLFAGYAQAQTTNAVTIISGGNSATNWVAIPYLAYDTGTKRIGGGAALLYAVNDNFWTGVRAQSLNGQSSTAGVQGQLQITETVMGVSITPFAETAFGLGSSSLYANVGSGGLINFHTWQIGKGTLSIGLVADYEHYVYGSISGNQINGGPRIRASF